MQASHKPGLQCANAANKVRAVMRCVKRAFNRLDVPLLSNFEHNSWLCFNTPHSKVFRLSLMEVVVIIGNVI